MNEIVKPGAPLLYMKVGQHAGEPLERIVERKTKEIKQAGFALWGYGGSTCHPLTVVQPFARDFERKGQTIYLCMEPMTSRHFAPTARATEFSADGLHWETIPKPVNVLGSRYALRIVDLQHEEFDLPLSATRVAGGRQEGKSGDRYITGRVDKACLEVVDARKDSAEEAEHRIKLVARLEAPYAVFVRNV
jgi:hypothetical protein